MASARGAKKKKAEKAATRPDGFINVAVSRTTRHGLHLLKEAMGVQGQSEVIERLVAIGIAIHLASR
ncbi:MAG: hypothetical protein ACM3Q0_00730 [Bacteroidota bacterium]